MPLLPIFYHFFSIEGCVFSYFLPWFGGQGRLTEKTGAPEFTVRPLECH